MAEWRDKYSPCPIDEEPIEWIKCGDCQYFRGMSSVSQHEDPEDMDSKLIGVTKLLCNWPRNGNEIWRYPLPSYLTEEIWDE